MSEKETRKIDFPFLKFANNVIGEYMEHLTKDPIESIRRTENDEQVLLFTLAGLGGLLEFNVRNGYQKLAWKKGITKDTHFNFSDTVEALSEYIPEEKFRKLLKVASQVRNKLMHSDFPELYKKTKKAYEIKDVGYHFKKFEPMIKTILVSITGLNCTLDVQSGVVKSSDGKPIPSRLLVPGAGDCIDVDFRYFYETGHFAHVFDVLFTCYLQSASFRYSIFFEKERLLY